MRKSATLAAIAAISMFAACQKTGEGEFKVETPDVDVSTDTTQVRTPSVDVGTDTAKVTVPDVDVKTPSERDTAAKPKTP
ncbi:MAG TPA: hypothetical protein VFY16_06555 [Gemmatimonadaceae bacterium]|nr:hypothetical protein [Gemmatimonadaceae bacterium]